MQDVVKLWNAALGELELQMTRSTFNTWVKPTTIVSWKDDTVVLGTPNGYIKDWLENRLYAPIQRTLSGVSGQAVNVQFIVWTEEQDVEESGGLPLLNTTPQAAPAHAFAPGGTSPAAPLNHNGHMPLNPK